MEIAAYFAFLFIFVEGLTVLFFPAFVKYAISISTENILRGAALTEIIISAILFVLFSYR